MESDGQLQAVHKSSIFSVTNALFAVGLIVAVIVTIYFRIPLLRFVGFYEPDGFYHFSVIREAVANGFVVPKYLDISGWPKHAAVTEPSGLYWVTLLPYFFLRSFGVTYYTIMRLLPIVYGIFDVIGAWLLSRYLSKDKFFGFLVMLFVALNMGNAARTSALIYRGDGFIVPFLIAALILTIEMFRTDDQRRKIALMVLSAFALSLCNAVWNGAPFTTAIYVLFFALMLLFGFVLNNKKLVGECKYLLGTFVIWYILVTLYETTGFIIVGEAFTGVNFLLLFAAMGIGFYLADQILENRYQLLDYFNAPVKRLGLFVGFVLLAVLAIYAIIPGFVYQIFISNGFIVTSNFLATIQELQPPTPAFIYASFGIQTFMTPMGILIYLFTYYGQFAAVFWSGMLLLFAPYFFMHVENDGGLESGDAKWNFSFSPALLVLVSFFALTAYLQIHAIRFNSLISVPLSIFCAYTVYWLAILAKKFKPANFVAYALIIVLVLFLVKTDLAYTSSLTPADSINTQFLNALSWFGQNSPLHSVVLTLWPDGSVVEGVANRTSVTDSVGAQNLLVADPFAAWIFNSSDDPQFLTGNLSGRPDYLLVRNTWLAETGGIFTEGNLTASPQNYGYTPFTGLSERVNGTTDIAGTGMPQGIYNFTLPLNQTTQLHGLASFFMSNGVINAEGGSFLIRSEPFPASSALSPFSYIALYDADNNNYTIIRSAENLTATNGQTLLITYSAVPKQGLPVNITGALLLAPGLASSNMAKFLYFCGSTRCSWDNNVASLQLVYPLPPQTTNSDTKIFKIIYNSTA